MADILISKFTTQIPRVGATPATPGFAESEGQDPVAPSGTPQVYTPVTIGSPANGLDIDPSTQVLTIGLASTSTTGALSSTDWNTFNGKIGGSGTTNYLSKFTGSGTIGDSAVFESGGNVGIGTATPVTKLQVNTSFATDTSVTISNTVASTGLTQSADGSFYLFNFGAFNLILGTNSAERVRITSSGNVGIGTTSPNDKLDVFGGNIFLGYSTGTQQENALLGVSKTDQFLANGLSIPSYGLKWGQVSGGAIASHISGFGGILFYAGNNQRVKIESNGNVLIGRNSDVGGTLQVNLGGKFIGSSDQTLDIGTFGATSYIQSYGASLVATPLDFYTGTALRARISEAGNLLVGTTTDSGQMLQVNGSTYINGNSYRAISANFTTGFATIDILQNNNRRVFFGFASGALTGGFGVVSDAGVEHTINIVRSNGNVLIGTTSDLGQRLQVSGDGYFSGNVGVGVDSPLANLHVNSGILNFNQTQPALGFTTTANQNTYIYSLQSVANDASANVGFVTGLASELSVNANVPYRWRIGLATDGNATTGHALTFSTLARAESSYLEVFRFNANGHLGLGTNNPTQLLDVNGRIRVRSLTALGSSPTIVAVPDSTGVFYSRTLSQFAVDLGVPNLINVSTDVTVSGAVKYNGTTRLDGTFYGSTSNPNTGTRLNWCGDLYARRFTAIESTTSQFFLSKSSNWAGIANNGTMAYQPENNAIGIHTIRCTGTNNAYAVVSVSNIDGVVNITVIHSLNVTVSVTGTPQNISFRNTSGVTLDFLTTEVIINKTI